MCVCVCMCVGVGGGTEIWRLAGDSFNNITSFSHGMCNIDGFIYPLMSRDGSIHM